MWTTTKTVVNDQNSLLELDDDEGWEVLITDLGYFDKRKLGLTPFQAYTWYLTQKKILGKYQELFMPRGFLLTEAIRLRQPRLVDYYIRQGTMPTNEIFQQLFEAGIDYLPYLTRLIRRDPLRLRSMESFPRDPKYLEALLKVLIGIGDTPSTQYLLRRGSEMSWDKVDLKPIWKREIRGATIEPLILSAVYDPVPPDLAKLETKNEITDPKALYYLVKTGSRLWKEIAEKHNLEVQ